MKICVAQTKPFKGNIAANIDQHIKLTNLAVDYGADAVFFPELSITGYEPELAKDLATSAEGHSLDEFQEISNHNYITIGLGVPTHADAGVQISMLIFQPNQPRQKYSKQQLHSDELPFLWVVINKLFLLLAIKK